MSIHRRKPEIPLEKLQRRAAAMDAALADARVTGYENLVESLAVFGNDAHVVAAAIVGRADVIVTRNLKDFPDGDLGKYNLTAQSPDDFLMAQWDLKPQVVRKVLEQQAQALRHPPATVHVVLMSLGKTVPRFASAALSAFEADIAGDFSPTI
jgi:hypothetical protein